MTQGERITNDAQTASLFYVTDDDVVEVEGYLDISVQGFRELYKRAMRSVRERFLRSTLIEKIMRIKVG